MANPWRNCGASLALVAEVNARWPGRDKASDGTVGDAAHATRASDHNPWVKDANGMGVVRARDVDKDGIDAAWLAEHLRTLGAVGDNRLTPGGYVIFNRRITTPDFLSWRAYTGSNPHTAHVHVSFSTSPAGYDSTRPWGVANAPALTPEGNLFMAALSEAEQRELLDAARSVLFGIAGTRPAGPTALAIDGITQDVKALRAEMAALHKTTGVDPAVLAEQVSAAVAEALGAGLEITGEITGSAVPKRAT